MKIKAAILESFKKPLLLKNITIPPLNKGQVLVKLYYSGICKSQLMEIEGGRNNKKYLPHMLGHEGSGIVIKTGKNVTKVKKGDEVILTWIKSKGLNCKGGSIKHINKKINFGPITTFSNYSLISENRIVKKPKFLSRKLATLFGCALSTGAGMILKQPKLTLNKKVLIYGLGGIGFCSLITLLATKHKKIYVYDHNIERMKLAERMGAKKINLLENKSEYCNYFDLCIETCGKTETIENGLSLIKYNGKLIFASHPSKNKKIRIDPHELIRGKKILGSWGGSTNLEKDLGNYYKILKNKINLFNFLTNDIYSLSQINVALSRMKKGLTIRPLIKF